VSAAGAILDASTGDRDHETARSIVAEPIRDSA
jgi:hypothetical protein